MSTLSLEAQTALNARISDQERVLESATRLCALAPNHNTEVFCAWLRQKIEDDTALLNGRARRVLYGDLFAVVPF